MSINFYKNVLNYYESVVCTLFEFVSHYSRNFVCMGVFKCFKTNFKINIHFVLFLDVENSVINSKVIAVQNLL